jgi:hypothetical protein
MDCESPQRICTRGHSCQQHASKLCQLTDNLHLQSVEVLAVFVTHVYFDDNTDAHGADKSEWEAHLPHGR